MQLSISVCHVTLICTISVIRDDFRQEPVDTTRSVGSSVVLHCKPPRGEPEVQVSWLKNGKELKLDERVQVADDGDLSISMVTKYDAGQYVCLGRNTAGEKLSSPAQLTVLGKYLVLLFKFYG